MFSWEGGGEEEAVAGGCRFAVGHINIKDKIGFFVAGQWAFCSQGFGKDKFFLHTA